MIVYRDAEETADPGPLLAACRTSARRLATDGATHDEAVELLIDLGVLEAAVVDALCPEADGMPPLATALRRASLAAGRLVRHSWRREPGGSLRETAGTIAAGLEALGPLPRPVRLRVPEGYAFYGLYPETYLEAAERLAASAGPGRAVCVGLRSIGTSLSAVAAAALDAAGWAVESVTLRPRGHPFARRPALEPGLAEALRARRDEAWFLVIDEGPGLSGSSLAGTAELLAGLGVPDERVVLFPSHLPDPRALNSAPARERWPRHPKAHASFEEAWLPRAPFPPGSRDVGGGGWREALGLPEHLWPAVEPRHERRKYLAEGAGGGRVLHKFVGLGRYGREAHARAVALAQAGFAPPVHGFGQGFLAQAFVAGRPLGAGEATPGLLGTAGRYLGHLARAFALDAPARPEALLDMVRANVAESLGEAGLAGLAGLERHLRGFGEVPAVAIDGRVLPHEWLRTADGFLKTDATDHHRDHFFPGYADIAWDVAGLGVEFGLGDAALGSLAAEVARRAGSDPGLAGRLPFYRTAYAAFRLGYTTHAAQTLGPSPDAERMARLAARYRAQLGAALCRLAAVLPDGTGGRPSGVAR